MQTITPEGLLSSQEVINDLETGINVSIEEIKTVNEDQFHQIILQDGNTKLLVIDVRNDKEPNYLQFHWSDYTKHKLVSRFASAEEKAQLAKADKPLEKTLHTLKKLSQSLTLLESSFGEINDIVDVSNINQLIMMTPTKFFANVLRRLGADVFTIKNIYIISMTTSPNEGGLKDLLNKVSIDLSDFIKRLEQRSTRRSNS